MVFTQYLLPFLQADQSRWVPNEINEYKLKTAPFSGCARQPGLYHNTGKVQHNRPAGLPKSLMAIFTGPVPRRRV
ncbi:MAG: hypothetical protein J6W44_03590, partial [Oscillospiraceae bacterium]|nr:hypothetical protein [Oscillospiraceae bacterium]